MRSIGWLVVGGSLAVLSASTAWAGPARPLAQAPGSPEAVRAAKAHFERALDAYREGAYRTAIEELREALRLDPGGKDLVYNLALVHEKLGEVDAAIREFRRFTEMETDPAEVERVQGIIKRLEGARDELRRKQEASAEAAEPAETPDVTPRAAPDAAPREKGRMDGLVIGAAGVSAAAALVGVVYGVRAVSTAPGSDERTGPGTTVFDLQRRADDAHSYAVVADVAFVVSALSGGLAAALYFGRDAEPAPRTAATLSLPPGGVLVGARSRF